jgi:hypothetical protein
MRVKPFTVCLLALTFLLSSTEVLARTKSANSEWSVVQALSAGTRVSVKDKAGKSVSGRIEAVTDQALTVSLKTGNIVIDRQNVARVVLENGRSVGHSTLVGAGIGAGSGATVGGVMIAAFGGGEDGTGPAVMAFTTLIGAIAGTVSGLLGGIFRQRKVVYESK